MCRQQALCGSDCEVEYLFERFVSLLEQYAANGSVPMRMGRRHEPGHVWAGPPARPEDIAEVERQLGHPLPDDYRAFLERWNGAAIFTWGQSHTPCVFGTHELLDSPSLLDDPRVLTIGMLADEAFLVLDRRVRTAHGWPVYWADELDSADELLERPAIANSFAEFLDRFVESEGSWYWVRPEPLEWYQDPKTLGLWRHGLGLFFLPYKYYHRDGVRHYIRLGLPSSSHAMTAPAALIAMGLRDHLLRLGGTFGVPRDFGWPPNHPEWVFGFGSNETALPKFKPADIPPAVLAGGGWQAVAPGLWIHGASGVCFWSRRANTHTGGPPIGTYILTWPVHAAKVAEPLRERLSRIKTSEFEPGRLPPGYDGVEFSFWARNGVPPEILPI